MVKSPTSSIVYVPAVAPPGTEVMTSLIVKLVTDSVSSTSLSLLSTLPVVVFASSRIVKVSAIKTESSFTSATLMVAV